ncbi:MAG TPA: RNA polymerase sigma factor [Myxococcales bacterium]
MDWVDRVDLVDGVDWVDLGFQLHSPSMTSTRSTTAVWVGAMQPAPAQRDAPGQDLAGLVRAAQEGDRAASRALFDRFQKGVMGYCLLSAKGDRERAMDLAQETFARAFRSVTGLTEPERFQGWLFTIAANVCRTRGDQEHKRQQALDALAVEREADLPADDQQARERRIALVQRLLAGVQDEKLRQIVTLKYGEPEHTTREIAAKLDVPHGTVTVKLMRFRDAVKRDLCRMLLEEGEA